MDWSTTVKAARIRHGLKQSALADYLGTDQATISRWERGVTEPTVAMKKHISRIMEQLHPDGRTVDRVRHSILQAQDALILTFPGNFATSLASPSARAAMSIKDGREVTYNWEAEEKSLHQEVLYGPATNSLRLFDDPLVTHVVGDLTIRMPDGAVRFYRCDYYPIWLGDGKPRILVRGDQGVPYTGQDGRITVHRVLGEPEVISLENEYAARRRRTE